MKGAGVAAAPGRLTEAYESGGKVACFYVHAPKLEARRQGGWLLRPRAQAGSAAARRPASTSTRPSWKRGGKVAWLASPALFVGASPERRIERARSPAWIIHAPKLEARRQGGWLWSHWGCVAKGSLRVVCRSVTGAADRAGPIASVDYSRAQAGNAAVRWPASTSTRPSWKGDAAARDSGFAHSGSCGRRLAQRVGMPS